MSQTLPRRTLTPITSTNERISYLKRKQQYNEPKQPREVRVPVQLILPGVNLPC